MATSAAAPPDINWGCDQWADCSCASSEKKCECAAGACQCGTITIAQVKEAMAKACPYSDCGTCKQEPAGCKCDKQCSCGGGRPKTKTEWVQWVKTQNPTGCPCK
ncbi:hypothetical protein BU14_0393s0001 [Porphyra umbilicalis]|uniref:Metallothionein n=1 Tax=Porphyra umbilicalis TaxID=2786 RepID=A0A1X6NWZ7_PORUM|nr:hypothetical protein BU14_0393s0001 [Porphyra umbilicalis]|eukprot:OSX72913.1 hypothetical protein BU14_0393s0001 [Porphyra umbilicalis]